MNDFSAHLVGAFPAYCKKAIALRQQGPVLRPDESIPDVLCAMKESVSSLHFLQLFFILGIAERV